MKTIVDLVEEQKEYLLGKDTAAKQAVESNIAPVEADPSSASRAYVVGEQLFLNDVLYDVISPISVEGAIVVGTNITAANKLSADIKSKIDDLYSKNQTLTNEVSDISDEIADMNSVLGAKNLLPFSLADIIANNTAGTWNGKTFTQTGSTLEFTLNDDGSITVDGTANSSATATLFLYGKSSLAEANDFKGMILSGCPSGGTTNGYSFVAQGFNTSATSSGTNYNDLGSGVTIGDKNYLRVYVRVQAGVTVSNLTFYPMIRLASITDDTYEPYAKTNQQLTKDTTGLIDNLEVNGAVNMLPNNATTQTINGVTFTVNSDGTVTANGTATANAVLKISDRFTLADYIGRKYVDAKKNEASSSTYSLIITYRNGSGAYVNETYVPTEGFILSTISNATLVEFGIFVKSGQSVSNLTFKPMITVPSYNGDYVPYAKSNKELTELTSQLALSVISGNSGNVFNISCNVVYGRALVITPYSIGCMAYWSGAYHYIQIAANSAITVTVSNESSTGLTLTFTGSTVNVTIMSLTNRNDIWSGTRVS